MSFIGEQVSHATSALFLTPLATNQEPQRQRKRGRGKCGRRGWQFFGSSVQLATDDLRDEQLSCWPEISTKVLTSSLATSSALSGVSIHALSRLLSVSSLSLSSSLFLSSFVNRFAKSSRSRTAVFWRASKAIQDYSSERWQRRGQIRHKVRTAFRWSGGKQARKPKAPETQPKSRNLPAG